jgi:imidazoleglycerol phosphate dehydratase HisB
MKIAKTSSTLSPSRKQEIQRTTTETDVQISLTIDGSGKRDIDTSIGFLDHMLEQFTKHGLFDLEIKAAGDTHFDDHHIVEDIGIVLGQAFNIAIGDKRGINRYGFFILPMDDTLTTVAFDFAGRYSFGFDVQFDRDKVGNISTELFNHFWDAFAQNARANLFIKSEYGRNDHHKAEGIFKAVAKAIRVACAYDERATNELPSTKGML